MIDQSNAQPTANVPATTKQPQAEEFVLTPEAIGKLSAQAISSSEMAAKQWRDLGRAAAEMGRGIEAQCNQTAADFEEHGRGMASHIAGYADRCASLGQQTRDIREKLRNGQ